MLTLKLDSGHQEDGNIDRKKLGRKIFSDEAARRKLNEITHYYIRWEMAKRLFWNFLNGTQLVVLDIPLLFETNFHKFTGAHFAGLTKTERSNRLQCGSVCRPSNSVATVNEKRQHKQWGGADKVGFFQNLFLLYTSYADDRINAQMPMDQKVKFADYVIDNSGSLSHTSIQVDQLCQKIIPPPTVFTYRSNNPFFASCAEVNQCQ